MKSLKVLAALLLVLGMAFGAASHARADYTLWTPSPNEDQNALQLTNGYCEMTGADGLYINAPGATQGFTNGILNSGSASLLSWTGPGSFSGVDFTIAKASDNTWNVYIGDTASGPALLNLGSTDQFALYFYYGGSVIQPLLQQSVGASDIWQLGDNCSTVYLADAFPQPTVGSNTPIPPSILLMGSGLAAVFGFLRRFSA